MNDQRCETVFTGRVQGVGFRATTHRLAQSMRITGWVRNEPDGSVRLVAEGPEPEIRRFLDRVRDTLGQFIHTQTDNFSTSRREFTSFDIRR